ncbi:DMT family transporter [Cytobacillus oceanisediminis]|uniref:Drug/metabolite transporter (DMT)-like permease n=1 Tax=Cytobacillus oceanisediminis TaxID=665099 RepID=A0A562K3L9_9BACI|nr:DMT family transporter [Cytobacillus oceanisediminis]TWH89824.1 drug/metabolite transporter (DMT)-like permease [Cytobacillus oceanisediminis]
MEVNARKLIIIGAHISILLLWASAFPAIRAGLQSYSPEHLALLRLLIGSAALAVFALVTRMRLPDVRDLPAIFILGFLGFTVYHTALNIGEQTVSAGPASLIVSLTPIFSAALAALFLGERFGGVRWLGSAISFAGVAIISIGTGDRFEIQTGILFVLLASVSESVYFVFQTKYFNKYGFLEFTTFTIWAGTIFMMIYLPGLGGEILKASTESTLSVVYLGLFPTVIPYIALAFLASKGGASEATSSLYLTPALAFVIAWIWLGETPAFLSIAGGVIALIGVLVIHKKEKVKIIDRELERNKVSK